MPGLTKKQRKARRLRCLGHVINLAAKAFIYGKNVEEFIITAETTRMVTDTLRELTEWRSKGPVGRLHNIITFICRTPQRRGAFADAVKVDGKSDFDHLNLTIDNATRWNSLYSMIERALKLRDRITRYCDENENEMHGPKEKASRTTPADEQQKLLKHDKLTSDDWKVLQEILNILKPFYTFTKRAEGKGHSADRGVVSEYLVTLNELLLHIRTARNDLAARVLDIKLQDDAIDFLKTSLLSCWVKLDEYSSKSTKRLHITPQS